MPLDPERMTLAEIREFVDKMGPATAKQVLGQLNGWPVRMSQCIVTAVDWTARQCTVREFGDSFSKVNTAWVTPGVVIRPNQAYWLMKWGADAMVIGQSSGVMYSTPTHGRIPAAQLRSSSPPSVQANYVWQKYSFNFKGYDTDTLLAAGSGPWDEIVIVTPGIYHCEARIYFGDASTVPVQRGLRISNQGNTTWYDEDTVIYDNTVASVLEQSLHCSCDHWFGVGQIITMYVAQDGGGALTVLNRGYAAPRLSVTYQGPEP